MKVNWEILTQSFRGILGEVDLSLLLRPETFLALLVALLIVERKRGFWRALLSVIPAAMALLVLWNQLLLTQGDYLHNFLYGRVLGVGAMMLLYVLYIYTIREQVD
jgi:hypothetical protein